LEDIIIILGIDSNDPNVVQESIKNRNADIQTLCKKKKLLVFEHPQTQEIGEM